MPPSDAPSTARAHFEAADALLRRQFENRNFGEDIGVGKAMHAVREGLALLRKQDEAAAGPAECPECDCGAEPAEDYADLALGALLAAWADRHDPREFWLAFGQAISFARLARGEFDEGGPGPDGGEEAPAPDGDGAIHIAVTGWTITFGNLA